MVKHVVAAVVNSTVEHVDVGSASSGLFVVLPVILSRFFVFLAAPFLYLEMWWLLVHLLLTFVLFEWYFERHHREELGWSAALANSIVMVFISMELLRSVYHHEGSPFSVLWQVVKDYWLVGALSDQMIIVSFVLLLGAFGLFTAVINYFHLLPRRIAYLVSGHRTVNLCAYFLIVVVYRYTHGDALPLDWLTVVALCLHGLLLLSLLSFVNRRLRRRGRDRRGRRHR